ncbi:MAG: serine aminopeptidase domain-containing protein [Patescibacteria group bacterium]
MPESLTSIGNLEDFSSDTQNDNDILSFEVPSKIETSETQKLPRISKINLNAESSCRGTVENKQELGTRQLEQFRYFHSNIKSRSFMRENADALESAEYHTYMYALGLENINANVFSREAGELGDKIKEKNVYVLLHGWTGNESIYSSVKQENQLTIAEEIMAKDPNAVVITMDGNGFGETNFREDVLQGDLQQYCTPEAYAAQVDFFVSHVLGFKDEDKDNVSIMGHSMGGAAAMILGARYGYENTVALSPALFPSKENLLEIEETFEDATHASKMEDLLKRLGYRTSGDGRYAFVGTVAKVGAQTKKALPQVTNKATEVFFNFVGPNYMGEEITGNLGTDKQLVSDLMEIHRGEVDKHALVDYALTNLRRGVDFSSWSLEEITRLNDSAVLTSEKDKLVTPKDVVNLLKTISSYELLLASSKSPEDLNSNEINAIKAQVEAVNHGVESETLQRIIVPGGHYATVYNEAGVDILVHGAAAKRALREAKKDRLENN